MQENGSLNSSLSFGEFKLDTDLRRLLRSGEPVPLHARTFDLLELLTQRNGEIVSKDEILDTIWNGQFVEEANLTVQVSALRKALGETSRSPRFLVTVPGKGYKFVANIEKAEREVEPESATDRNVGFSETAEKKKEPATEKPNAVKSFARFYVLAAVLALFLIAFSGYWLFKENQAVSGDPTGFDDRHLKIKRLTNHGRTDIAVLSPDGVFFAYGFREKGSFPTELRVGQTDGGSEMVLRPLGKDYLRPKAFSSDGIWLYYVATEPNETIGTLYKIPVLGGVPQKLADQVDLYLALSPDEKHITYIRDDPENETSALVIADISGGNERQIAERPKKLAFMSGSQSWSADGQFIAVSAENGPGRLNSSVNHQEIFVVRVSDGSIEQLTSLEWSRVYFLEWLKDASGLIAVARGGDRRIEYQLWQIGYPDGKVRLFSRDVDTYGGALSLSADSGNLLVIQREFESNIWIAPTENLTDSRQITFSSSWRLDGWYGMDWTPDGQIVHTAWIDQSLTVWKMDALGANAVQLTATGFRDERPAVSPDGKWVAFHSDRSGDLEIWRVSIDGGDPQQLTRVGGNSYPSITPDGNWVIYRHIEDGKGSIWRVPSDGGEPERISTIDLKLPHLSPDGRFIAGAASLDGKTHLTILSAETGDIDDTFDVPATTNFRFWLCWSADGRSVTYPDEANGIWRQPVEGGSPGRVSSLPEEKLFSHAWSPDGHRLAFGRVREVRDAVLIANIR